MARYETLAAVADHSYFAVKPPGQLLAYVALDRLAQRVVPENTLAGHPLLGALTPRHRQLIELLAWLLPWLAALAVFPIAGVTRVLSTSDLWLTAPLLFALSAPLTLITLHLDQAVYPAGVATLWWCSVRAGRSEHHAWAWGTAGGLVAWLLAFLSFGLLPAVVLGPGLVAAAAPQRRLRRTMSFAVGALAAGAALWVGFLLAFAYDPTLRYARALAAHAAWKHWSWDLGHVGRAALMNLVEFGWWANPALVVAWLKAISQSAKGVLRRNAEATDHLVLTVVALIVAMATFGQTFAETARLWLFILPLMLWSALRALGPFGGRTLALLCGLQWVWTVAVKHAQDFY